MVGIAAGGAAGAVLRQALAGGGGWAALLLVNVAGCALLGILAGRRIHSAWLTVGVCGALTTFSGIALQARAAAAGSPPGAWTVDGGGQVPAGAVGALLLLVAGAGCGIAALLIARRLTAVPDR